MQATPSQRHLPLEGTYNVRDIGGYQTTDGRMTRWGVLFRADGLHRLSTEAQSTFLAKGLKSVVDLRRSEELRHAPNVFAQSSQVNYHHISLMVDEVPVVDGDPPPLVDRYRMALDERQAQLLQILSTLAAPDGLPAVVHCTAGKDRTGLTIALILGLCGVPNETIIADYALTSEYLGEGFMADARKRVLHRGYTWEQYYPLLTCPPENMEVTLEHLMNTYGNFEAYATHIGLSSDQISRLRKALVVGE